MAMDASPLAKLPAELRNNIYHEVLLQQDTIKLTFKPAKNAIELAMKSVTLNIGEYEANILDNYWAIPAMVMDLKRDLLTAYPCLPLKLGARIYGVGEESLGKEDIDVELDMQNLASSVGGALEQVKELHQKTQDEEEVFVDYDDNGDNENYRRGFRLERLSTLIDELHACLQ
ncbi:hypothetical protein KC367_g2123 [Hortaea werneckii]|nr:hypothetical protein KC367_g2123 [Hortaea werneckii]